MAEGEDARLHPSDPLCENESDISVWDKSPMVFHQLEPVSLDGLRFSAEDGAPNSENRELDILLPNSDLYVECIMSGQECFSESTSVANEQMQTAPDFDEVDQILDGLPKDLYIDKLLICSNDQEKTIQLYRDRLAEKARDIEGCPVGALVCRRTTLKCPSIQKNAMDCYNLYMFLKGEKSAIIDDIFNKNKSDRVFFTKIPQRYPTEANEVQNGLVDTGGNTNRHWRVAFTREHSSWSEKERR